MHLNAFLLFCAAPVTRLSWVYPEERIRHQWWEMPCWEEIATTLEEGSFDALFLADNIGGYGNGANSIRFGNHFPLLDPALLVPRLAATTSNLGFVVTMSTTFVSPARPRHRGPHRLEHRDLDKPPRGRQRRHHAPTP